MRLLASFENRSKIFAHVLCCALLCSTALLYAVLFSQLTCAGLCLQAPETAAAAGAACFGSVCHTSQTKTGGLVCGSLCMLPIPLSWR